MPLGAHRPPTSEEMTWLCRYDNESQSSGAVALKKADRAARASTLATQESGLQRQHLLREFGILSAGDLACVGSGGKEVE